MTKKICYTNDGSIQISCPKCGKDKLVDVSQYLKMDKVLNFKATCKCKHVFSITIERRQHIRKKVDLKGSLTHRSKQYPVKIIDISKLGMGIITQKPLNIYEGERLVVDFVLDDQLRSKVSKDIVVSKKSGTKIGCKFFSDDHYDAFGKYMLFYFQ